ncbi:MAG: hypothetical protein FJX65_14115 [Alphaproteobacteria bacterium]|nr:hypothetical protein [Alphaproteobacteria bacterium]
MTKKKASSPLTRSLRSRPLPSGERSKGRSEATTVRVRGGRTYKSPLQAKWAAFLNALEAAFDYEGESHEFRGASYRPHFLVRDWNCWIETVPGPLAKIDIFRCLELSRASQRQVLLIVGEPAEHTIVLFDPSGYFPREGSAGWQFGQGQAHEGEIWLYSEDGAFTLRGVEDGDNETMPLVGEDAPHIMAALVVAQEA